MYCKVQRNMVFFNFKSSQMATILAGVVLLFGAGMAVISLQQQQQTSSRASGYGSCSVGGKNGICQNKNTTPCSGGTYHAGYCPGPANIQCCVKSSSSGGGVGQPCTAGGKSGICQKTTTACTGTYSKGNCTGTSVECCLKPVGTAGDTFITFDLLLHGIGKAGDNVLPGAAGGGNINPKHPLRQVEVNLFGASNQLKATGSGFVTFDPTSGSFKGKINMGKKIVTNAYIVKVKFTQSLWTAIPGFPTIKAGQDNVMKQISLVTGDINDDGTVSINIADYNILIGCYSYFSPAVSCDAKRKQEADLNDDGNVNQTDLNLFLRELSQRK